MRLSYCLHRCQTPWWPVPLAGPSPLSCIWVRGGLQEHVYFSSWLLSIAWPQQTVSRFLDHRLNPTSAFTVIPLMVQISRYVRVLHKPDQLWHSGSMAVLHIGRSRCREEVHVKHNHSVCKAAKTRAGQDTACCRCWTRRSVLLVCSLCRVCNPHLFQVRVHGYWSKSSHVAPPADWVLTSSWLQMPRSTYCCVPQCSGQHRGC
jgi:hypothetical protein